MWGHLKTHEIANLIVTQAWELSLAATAALRRMRRRRSIVAACFTQAECGVSTREDAQLIGAVGVREIDPLCL